MINSLCNFFTFFSKEKCEPIKNSYKTYNLENIIGKFYVESIYDGDTITLLVPMQINIYDMINKDNFDIKSNKNLNNSINYYKIKVRLLGIDTPEIKPKKDLENREEHIKKAYNARDYLSNLILNKIIKVEFTPLKI